MARGRQPRVVEGRTWHRDSGTVGRSRRFAVTGHVSHRRVGALVGRSTGHEVVSHGSGFGDRGQSGKTPPSCSALRWLQDVGGSPLACLGVAVVMTNDHDFDRDEIRSEEQTSELQSLMRISYAVFCLKKKKYNSTMTFHN